MPSARTGDHRDPVETPTTGRLHGIVATEPGTNQPNPAGSEAAFGTGTCNGGRDPEYNKPWWENGSEQ